MAKITGKPKGGWRAISDPNVLCLAGIAPPGQKKGYSEKQKIHEQNMANREARLLRKADNSRRISMKTKSISSTNIDPKPYPSFQYEAKPPHKLPEVFQGGASRLEKIQSPIGNRTQYKVRKMVNDTDWASRTKTPSHRMMRAAQEISNTLQSIFWRRCKLCNYWWDRQCILDKAGKTICSGCQAVDSFCSK